MNNLVVIGDLARFFKEKVIGNPFTLAKVFKINIIYSQYKDLKGIYLNTSEGKFIIINESQTPEQQKLICTIGLGHALLHGNEGLKIITTYNITDESKCDRQEFEAKLFATELLREVDDN